MTFIPYKIDHQVANTAKTLGFSKKRVSFKFGFANEEALERGETGPACRGSEHEVVFIWSLKSGKRQLFLNGKDVHYSESGQNGWTVDRAWQHSFPLRDPSQRTKEFSVHFISQPPRPEIPGFQPFDLRVNGVSFFKFNELWKLGTPDMVVRGGDGGSGMGRRYEYHRNNQEEGLSAEEQKLIAQAKLESLRDLAQHQQQVKARDQQQVRAIASHDDWANGSVTDQVPAPAAGGGGGDLISWEDPPPPSQVLVPAAGPSSSSSSYYALGAPPPPQSSQNSFSTAPPPSQQQQQSSYGGSGSFDYGAPAAPAPAYQPQQQQTQMTPYSGAPAPYYGGMPPAAPAPSNIYGAPPPSSNLYGAPPPASNPYGAPPPSSNPYGAPPPPASNPYGAPPASNPYGAPPASNPYGAPPPSSNPYGAPPPSSNPYGAPPPSSNPYGAPPPSSNPYGAPPPSSDMYGAPPPSSDMYGAPPQPATPSYGGGGAQANPFASPSGQTEYSYGSAAPAFARPASTPSTGGYQQQQQQYGGY